MILGHGCYAGIPSWLLPHVTAGSWNVVSDPPSEKPWPQAHTLGRVPAPEGGDEWEKERVRRGADGAREYADYCRPYWRKAAWCHDWLGTNEPMANDVTEARQLVEFYRAFVPLAAAEGVTVWPGSFSVGRPDENILTEYVPLLQLCGGRLSLHEYGKRAMWEPSEQGWYCGRWRRWLPVARAAGVNLRIVVTEVGLDDGCGYRAQGTHHPALSDDEFLQQLDWYARNNHDTAIVGGVLFHASSYSYASFQYTDYVAAGVARINAALLPITVKPPEEKPVADVLSDMLRAEFGTQYSDLRATLPVQTSRTYPLRAESVIKRIVVHHAASGVGATWQSVVGWCVAETGKNYPGSPYHIGVDAAGRVSYLMDIRRASWHCGTLATPEDDNWDTLAVSALGNYDTHLASAAMIDAMRRIVGVLDSYFGAEYPLLGHHDIAKDTVCPGQYLYPHLGELQEKMEPEVPEIDEQELRSQAWAALFPVGGIVHNPDAALSREARRLGLGVPVTAELDAEGCRYQGFAGGIMYCVLGDWANVKRLAW